MVDSLVVNPEVRAGSLLISELRQSGIGVRAAAWVFDEQKNRWLLHIAAPWPHGNVYMNLTRFFGLGIAPSAASIEISRAIKLEDVVPHQPDSAYGRALAKLSETSSGTAVLRIRDRYLEGIFFSEAIVYSLAP